LDDFKQKFLWAEATRLGVDPANLVFGVIGSAGDIASIASAVIVARSTRHRDRERNPIEGDLEMGGRVNTGVQTETQGENAGDMQLDGAFELSSVRSQGPANEDPRLRNGTSLDSVLRAEASSKVKESFENKTNPLSPTKSSETIIPASTGQDLHSHVRTSSNVNKNGNQNSEKRSPSSSCPTDPPSHAVEDDKVQNEGRCAVCQAVTTRKCKGCLKVFYCSREHQEKDWKANLKRQYKGKAKMSG
jgi:MYND finger